MTGASAGVVQGEYWPNVGVQWHLKVALALDMPYWAMRLAPHRLIRMSIVSSNDLMSCMTRANRPCYGPIKMLLVSSYIMAAR